MSCANLLQVRTPRSFSPKKLRELIFLCPGAVGLPAYAFKGIYEEINKTRGPNDEVIRLREQGEQEWDACEVDTKNEILRRWYEIQPPLYDFAEGKFQ